MALYHDRFGELAAALAAELDGAAEIDGVRAGLQEWCSAQFATPGGPGLAGITQATMAGLRAPLVKALSADTRRSVQATTREFVGNNVSQLSMISEPS